MEYVQWVGAASGILTSVSMFPQIIKTYKEKKAGDISLVMIFVLLSGVGGWIYYGFLRKDLPIIITNSFSFVLNLLLLILHWKYEEKKHEKK